MTHRDVFDGLGLTELKAEHYPQGIEYKSVQPEGMPALTMEISLFRQSSASSGTEKSHAIIVPPGFGTRMHENGRDTHHALRHAHLARITGHNVLAIGFPYGEGVDSLPAAIRNEIRKGNFAPYTDYLVQVAVEQEIETYSVDGFSLGGALTADLVLSGTRRGLTARKLLIGAGANFDTEIGALTVFGRYAQTLRTDKERKAYAQSSFALREELENRPKMPFALTAYKKVNSIMRPTPFAFAMGMGHGKLLAQRDVPLEYDPIKKLEAIRNIDGVEIDLYSGTKDTLVPIRVMRSVAKALDLPLKEFESETHALRDKLAVMEDYLTAKLA